MTNPTVLSLLNCYFFLQSKINYSDTDDNPHCKINLQFAVGKQHIGRVSILIMLIDEIKISEYAVIDKRDAVY